MSGWSTIWPKSDPLKFCCLCVWITELFVVSSLYVLHSSWNCLVSLNEVLDHAEFGNIHYCNRGCFSTDIIIWWYLELCLLLSFQPGKSWRQCYERQCSRLHAVDFLSRGQDSRSQIGLDFWLEGIAGLPECLSLVWHLINNLCTWDKYLHKIRLTGHCPVESLWTVRVVESLFCLPIQLGALCLQCEAYRVWQASPTGIHQLWFIGCMFWVSWPDHVIEQDVVAGHPNPQIFQPLP